MKSERHLHGPSPHEPFLKQIKKSLEAALIIQSDFIHLEASKHSPGFLVA